MKTIRNSRNAAERNLVLGLVCLYAVGGLFLFDAVKNTDTGKPPVYEMNVERAK